MYADVDATLLQQQQQQQQLRGPGMLAAAAG